MVFPVGSSLDFAAFRGPARCVFVDRVWGYQPGTSALTLLGDLQTLRRYHLGQALSDPPRSEQRNAFCSKPLLGDFQQLLERNFAGIAEELDRTCRLSQACPASKVVNHGATTRPPVVGWQRSETGVTALDHRAAELVSKTQDPGCVSTHMVRQRLTLPSPRCGGGAGSSNRTR